MSLTDIDKSGNTRGNPIINAEDPINKEAVRAHATSGIAYRAEDARTAPRVIEKDDQIIVHDGTNNKALFGRDGNGNYVVKVAKQGFDVLIADDDELIFNSQNNVFKIVDTDTFDYTIPATPTTGNQSTSAVVHTHNLGYAPLVVGFITSNTLGQIFAMPFFQFGNNVNLGSLWGISLAMQFRTTTTDIILDVKYSAPSFFSSTYSIRWYILQETAN